MSCASLLCDNCSNPGRCCTGFPLNAEFGESTLEALVRLATVTTWMGEDGVSQGRWGEHDGTALDHHLMLGLPFLPLWKTPGGRWRFWCPLLEHGRCSDYEHRPALCRDFKAGSDELCAMHRREVGTPKNVEAAE